MNNVKTGQLRQFVATIVSNLPDMPAEKMQEWIENPKELQKALKESLLPFPPVIPRELEVWKSIKIGGFSNVNEVREAIKKAGMNINNPADLLLEKIPLAKEQSTIKLVCLSMKDLGFNEDGAKNEEIFNRAKEMGLELCPAEVGPQLRLQYKDQPNEEFIMIAMEPIAVSNSFSLFFIMNGGTDLWLASHIGQLNSFWTRFSRFVFVIPG
jgi:hypothetical protein